MDGENNGKLWKTIKMEDLGGKPTIFGNTQIPKSRPLIEACNPVLPHIALLIPHGPQHGPLLGSHPRLSWEGSTTAVPPKKSRGKNFRGITWLVNRDPYH